MTYWLFAMALTLFWVGLARLVLGPFSELMAWATVAMAAFLLVLGLTFDEGGDIK